MFTCSLCAALAISTCSLPIYADTAVGMLALLGDSQFPGTERQENLIQLLHNWFTVVHIE